MKKQIKDIKLLKEVVEHWKRILHRKDKPGRNSCVLCTEYNRDGNTNPCKGCPIYLKTDRVACCDTPYEPAVIQHDNMSGITLIQQEITFLAKLRDEHIRKFIEDSDIKILKPFTAKIIYDQNLYIGCEVEFERLVEYYGFFTTIDHSYKFLRFIVNNLSLFENLVDHGFVGKKGKTYKVRDKFISEVGSYYILAGMPLDTVCLVNLMSGCPRTSLFTVKNQSEITERELECISGDIKMTKTDFVIKPIT